MARKANIADKVRKYMLKNPNASVAQIADACATKPGYVHAIRHQDKKARLAKAVVAGLAVRGKGDEYEQKGDKWVAVKKPGELRTVMSMTIKPDMVNHPPHYTVGGIETIDYIKAKLTPEEFRGYLKGNILKYGSRVGHKDDVTQDAGKLKWYATRYAESV